MVGPDTVVTCTHCGGEHRLGDVGRVLESSAGRDVVQLSEMEWVAILKAPLA